MVSRLNLRIIKAQRKRFLMFYIRRPFILDKYLCLMVVMLCAAFTVGKCHSLANEVQTSNSETDGIGEIGLFPCIKPILDTKLMVQISESVEKSKTEESGFFVSLLTPPVEIKPSLLDWGQNNMYGPSLAFLTVKNIDTRDDLSIYDIYSSNSQFYPCNSHEGLLGPSETTLLCFVFLPTQLGLSSAQLVLQTSFGGFLIEAKGFAVEYSLLNAEEWFHVESGEVGRMKIATRQGKKWEIGPQEPDRFIELDSLYRFDLSPDIGYTSVSLDASTLQGFGGSLSSFEGSNPEQSLEVNIDIQTSPEVSSSAGILNSSESKSDSCSNEVHGKNSGDIPLQDATIEVYGSNCGGDGIRTRNCRYFFIAPSESVMLQMLYVAIYSASALQMWLKKATIVIISIATLMPILVFLLFPNVKPYANPRSSKLSDRRKRSPSFTKANRSVKSVRTREKSVSESANRRSHALVPTKSNTNLSSDNNQPEIRSKSSEPSPADHAHDSSSDSRNLVVRIGKEKRSRRRKKKSSGIATTTSALEVSSSQSGNSTPSSSSPSSPYLPITPPKKPWPETYRAEHTHTPDQQHNNKSQYSVVPTSKAGSSNDGNKVANPTHNKNMPLLSQGKQNGTEKTAVSVRKVSSGTTSSPWTQNSPLFAGSTSRIDPQARAPGTNKLHEMRKTDDARVEDNDKYTYNIWGDHLFGLYLTNDANNSCQSFFVEEPKSSLLRL